MGCIAQWVFACNDLFLFIILAIRGTFNITNKQDYSGPCI